MDTLSIILIVLGTVFIVSGVTAELLSTNFVSMWFSLGSLCALISIPLGLVGGGQIILFLAVSVVTLSIFYPLIRKYNRSRKTLPTNYSKLIGSVTEVIDLKTDTLSINGHVKLISSRGSFRLKEPSQKVKVGDRVEVLEIHGTILIVQKFNPQKSNGKSQGDK